MAGNSIPFALPDIGQEEIDEVVDSLKSGMLTAGPKVKRFEDDFKAFIGCKHAIAVNSGTSGLHLALEAIGLKRGDKVVVPVNTFTATAEVIRYFDADPIFCDIDEKTFNLDVAKLQHIINSHSDIKAIMPVHIAGQACDMTSILRMAKEKGIFIIEDAAHAFPTTSNNQYIGTIGDITVFSFYPTKTISTAEGGMVTTENDKFAERIKIMRQHGLVRDASWAYSVVAAGYKYNMNELSASMGIHQLKKANAFLQRRKEIAKKYDEAFSKTDGIEVPYIANPADTHAFHLYIIKIIQRDAFIEKMASRGVGTSVHFIPLHLQPYWKEKYRLTPEDFPVASENFKEIVSLPIYTRLTNEEINRIIESVKAVKSELALSR